MRHLYALILATGFCVPSLALAAPDHRGSLPAASVAKPMAKTDGQHRAPASHVTSPRPASAAMDTSTSDDKLRYADKEAKSGKAQSYRGGDTVVSGASALTVVLVVLLIVILI